MYIYFKGVSMLLRGLLDGMAEKETTEEEAEKFLIEVEKVSVSVNLYAQSFWGYLERTRS